MGESEPFLALTPREAETAAAVFERMFPADENGPGAREIGVVTYLDRALAGAYREHLPAYRAGLALLDAVSRLRFGKAFADAGPAEQDALLAELERGAIAGWTLPEQVPFFLLLRAHLQEGLFSDPAYGGNRDKLGWRVLGHPGVWLDNTAEENLAAEPVTKGGRIQALADVADELRQLQHRIGDRRLRPTAGRRAAGGERRRRAGRHGRRRWLHRAGPGRRRHARRRAGGGAVVAARRASSRTSWAPPTTAGRRWARSSSRRSRAGGGNEREPTRELTFSLGRMMNGVGGSVIHYGGWLRRFPGPEFAAPLACRRELGPDVDPGGMHGRGLAGHVRRAAAELRRNRAHRRHRRRRPERVSAARRAVPAAADAAVPHGRDVHRGGAQSRAPSARGAGGHDDAAIQRPAGDDLHRLEQWVRLVDRRQMAPRRDQRARSAGDRQPRSAHGLPRHSHRHRRRRACAGRRVRRCAGAASGPARGPGHPGGVHLRERPAHVPFGGRAASGRSGERRPGSSASTS